MKPRISVIVPTFNSAQFLPRALQSLLDQTIDRRLTEIIVVDDCSEDNTWEIITDFATEHCHARAFQLEQYSRGPGRGRNVGVQEADGEWIAFLDADDAYLPDGMETLLKLAGEAFCDVASARMEVIHDGRRASPPIYDDVLPESLIGVTAEGHPELLWPLLSVFSRLFRAEYLTNNDIKFPEEVIAQDSVFSTEALLRASAISYSPEVVYGHHRDNARGSLSISDDLCPRYFSDWLETRRVIENLYASYSPRSYWELRYNTDMEYGMAQLLRFSRRLDLNDNHDRGTFLDVVTNFQDFCAHYESADLKNVAPFETVVPMLIGDGDVQDAVEIVRLWNAARRVANDAP